MKEKPKSERLKDQLTELKREGEPIKKTIESFIEKSETREDLQNYGFNINNFGYRKLLSYELNDGNTYQYIEDYEGKFRYLQNYEKRK